MLASRITSRVLSRNISRPLTFNFFTQKNTNLAVGLQKTIIRKYANDAKSVVVREPIDTIRRDLVNLIDDEVRQLTSEPGVTENYLAEIHYKLDFAEDTDKVTLTRTQDNHNITVEFTLPKEEDEEGYPEEEEEDPVKPTDKKEVDGESEEPAQSEQALKKLADFDVTIEKIDKKKKVILHCAVANDFRTYIESIKSDDSNRILFLEDLNEDLRERLYDYFGTLQIDDRLGGFVSDYREEHKLKSATYILEQLKHFLAK